MQYRAERGVCVRTKVTVKVVTAFPGPSGGNSVNAQLIKSSGAGMRLRLQFPVTSGSLVQISDGDDPVVGTVCSCVSESGTYVIGVRVSHDHALAG
jgi:hypothetical protein